MNFKTFKNGYENTSVNGRTTGRQKDGHEEKLVVNTFQLCRKFFKKREKKEMKNHKMQRKDIKMHLIEIPSINHNASEFRQMSLNTINEIYTTAIGNIL